MLNWHPEVEQLLKIQNYQALANYYEELVENNPDEISNYWYLGLAYLLLGKEENAQITWFMVLNELSTEEEIDAKSRELTTILEQEAQQQEQQENDHNAYLIRQHLRELEYDNLFNLMNLIGLEIKLGCFDVNQLQKRELIELLKDKNIPRIPEDLLIKTLNKVLYFVCEESVNFARACIEHSEGSQNSINAISIVATKLYLVDKLILYPVDLINVCREQKPDDLALIRSLLVFYLEDFKYYEQALKTATEFLEKSQTLTTRIYGLRQLLYLYIKNYNWQEGKTTGQLYIKEIIEFANQDKGYIEGFIASVLPMLPHNLLSLQDQPSINRYVFNQVNSRFQNITISLGAIGFQYQDYPNSLIKNRVLRIGYIGHTFRSHSVGWLCRWLIRYHDQSNFEIFIYSLSNLVDQLTEKWFIPNTKQLYSYSPDTYYENIIQQIREDQIDILIDVDSVTLNSTCEVMVHKSAPIQATWLGLDASGIPAIDYFIADPYVLPDNAQDYYSEKIWRLPSTYLGIDGFEVGIPTLTRENLMIEEDAIIFMNVQGSLKLHPENLKLQMRIIKNVPNSYLLVKGKDEQGFLQELYNGLATEEGVDFNRIRYLGKTPTELEHRANIQIADVVLDTYPYNGSTTTLETLWMEVPIVTRVGKQFAARNSYTYMMNAGITEGIAWSDQEYIEWGIKLGTDENLRKEISWKLKQSKKTSPLWNGKQFARDMENAYRQMWEIYVRDK